MGRDLNGADLASFESALQSVYISYVATGFSKHVHVYKFRDPKNGLEAFHLVNFDLDEMTNLVVTTNNTRVAFDPSDEFSNPQVLYYTQESPESETLNLVELHSGYLEVMISSLHVYGIVVVQETK